MQYSGSLVFMPSGDTCGSELSFCWFGFIFCWWSAITFDALKHFVIEPLVVMTTYKNDKTNVVPLNIPHRTRGLFLILCIGEITASSAKGFMEELAKEKVTYNAQIRANTASMSSIEH